MSSEIDSDKTLIHESGHALFGLQDEYCCDSNYNQLSNVPNIWTSLAGCQAEAADIGHPTSNCTQIAKGTTQSINFWYIDPSGPTGSIMGSSQHEPGSDFGKAGRRRINWRYGQCVGGQCMQIQPESAELTRTVAAAVNTENTFTIGALSLIPQLAVEVKISEEGAQALDSTIIYVPVQTDDTLGGDFAVRFRAGSEVIASYEIPDPRLFELEDQQYIVASEAQTFIYAPLSKNLTDVQIRPVRQIVFLHGPAFEPPIDTINLVPLVQQACAEQAELAECQ
jgi:hypothetical protein